MSYYLQATANNLWQYRYRNLFSIIIICFSFLTIGLFLSLSNNLQETAKSLSKELDVVFFLETEVSDAAIKTIKDEIEDSGLFISSVFVSEEKALELFKEKFPELLDILKNLDTNPFPASIEAKFDRKHLANVETDQFINKMKLKEEIEDIRYNRELANRMESLSRLAQAIGFFLGFILLFSSFLIVSNIIKLNVMARKSEIEILRLVGATNSFIRGPFLIEGIFLGIIGSLFSIALLFILIKLLPVYLGSSLGIISDLIKFKFLSITQCFIFVLSGAILGIIGSISSMTQFLKT